MLYYVVYYWFKFIKQYCLKQDYIIMSLCDFLKKWTVQYLFNDAVWNIVWQNVSLHKVKYVAFDDRDMLFSTELYNIVSYCIVGKYATCIVISIML